ncbi:MAG: sigma-54-dependent Fis family transcriptional regulator [Deltaproteobacteria bacterium]|nr:sigma-54-dependent Fis family transcriptional regulator [Deltaproteobacteria bacterium]
MSSKTAMLVINENQEYQAIYKDFFDKHGYRVFLTQNNSEILDLISKENIEIVLIGFKKPPTINTSLIKFLIEIKDFDQRVEVVLIAPHFPQETAVKAVKLGATDCISPPDDLDNILESLNNVTEYKNIRKQTGLLEREIRERYTFQGMISRNLYMLEIFTLVRRLAKHFTTVQVTGETGTGKEMIAKALHDLSPRSKNRFVPCNCSSFPESLLERELFGHVKGSFTGATDSKPGIFEYASGGTVFLDEIGEMEIPLQAKLLRVLENHKIRRIGSPEEISIDVQVIAATNKDLRVAVKDVRFREDLFYRINVVEIHLSPLRERKEDIPLLCHYFLSQFNKKFNKCFKGISRKAQILLANHTWEGNVRELQNVIESATILTTKDYISDQEISKQIHKSAGFVKSPISYGEDLSLEEVERQHIANILKKHGGNKVKSAAILGLSRRSLYRKIDKFNITW